MLVTKRMSVLLSLGTAAAAVLMNASAAPAHAASTCWDAHFTWEGREAYYCYNVSPTPVYGDVSLNAAQVGTLLSDPSWFLCKYDGGGFNGETSGPHPYRWLQTIADSPSGQWGWVPDKKIYSETNPVPNCFGS